MNSLAFFDTNILVYTDDASAPDKQRQAIELYAARQKTGHAVISLQVLQEYYVAATGKLGVDPDLAQRKVEIMARGRVVRFTESDVVDAIEMHRLRHISLWDALIVHAARVAGAPVLYSEDMQNGATISGVRIVNPFLVPSA